MDNEKLGKNEDNRKSLATRIPDPARREMIRKLRIVAIAVPAVALLMQPKDFTFAS
jgi:hypothetical protein